ncbi:MAG: hypothetical protein HQK53_10810 [Oligoflexia bacterium]|nr:hypothetical protein [Oligoflexia bacterium]
MFVTLTNSGTVGNGRVGVVGALQTVDIIRVVTPPVPPVLPAMAAAEETEAAEAAVAAAGTAVAATEAGEADTTADCDSVEGGEAGGLSLPLWQQTSVSNMAAIKIVAKTRNKILFE